MEEESFKNEYERLKAWLDYIEQHLYLGVKLWDEDGYDNYFFKGFHAYVDEDELIIASGSASLKRISPSQRKKTEEPLIIYNKRSKEITVIPSKGDIMSLKKDDDHHELKEIFKKKLEEDLNVKQDDDYRGALKLLEAMKRLVPKELRKGIKKPESQSSNKVVYRNENERLRTWLDYMSQKRKVVGCPRNLLNDDGRDHFMLDTYDVPRGYIHFDGDKMMVTLVAYPKEENFYGISMSAPSIIYYPESKKIIVRPATNVTIGVNEDNDEIDIREFIRDKLDKTKSEKERKEYEMTLVLLDRIEEMVPEALIGSTVKEVKQQSELDNKSIDQLKEIEQAEIKSQEIKRQEIERLKQIRERSELIRKIHLSQQESAELDKQIEALKKEVGEI